MHTRNTHVCLDSIFQPMQLLLIRCTLNCCIDPLLVTTMGVLPFYTSVKNVDAVTYVTCRYERPKSLVLDAKLCDKQLVTTQCSREAKLG